MKLQEKLKPICHLIKGNHGALAWGATLRKNFGYHAMITLFVGISALFSVVALAALALGKTEQGITRYLKTHPEKFDGFLRAVAILDKAAAFLTANTKE